MNKRYIIAAAIGAVVLSGCKEKKPTGDIITKKVESVEKVQGTQKMSSYEWSKEVEFMGKDYSLFIRRVADPMLPKAYDEQGTEYFDNSILLNIKRENGTTMFEKKFTKSDFERFTDNAYGKTGALLGIVFDRVEGDRFFFGASVGSPDTMSDEYIPLVVIVRKDGTCSIEKDTQLDTANENPLLQPKSTEPQSDPYEEDGV